MAEKIHPFPHHADFKEAISKIARVPAKADEIRQSEEFTYEFEDKAHHITYKIVSLQKLSAGDVRRALARAFSRIDVSPDESGVVEIRL